MSETGSASVGQSADEALAEVKAAIPHRPPFLFADRVDIVGASPGDAATGRIVGYRTFTSEDFFFKGHFPVYPVLPGVIELEAMFQIGGVGVYKMGIIPEGTFFLAKVKEARFRRQVRPGETFRAEITNLRATPRIVHQRGSGYVGDELCVEAEWISMSGGDMKGDKA
jgi:3-hydroxymyristoyl/3-hydroxydecanoyl-(acyl carrier protein) dehydratases